MMRDPSGRYTDASYADASVMALARASATYFATLIEQGLTRQEALQLTSVWVASLSATVQNQRNQQQQENP